MTGALASYRRRNNAGIPGRCPRRRSTETDWRRDGLRRQSRLQILQRLLINRNFKFEFLLFNVGSLMRWNMSLSVGSLAGIIASFNFFFFLNE